MRRWSIHKLRHFRDWSLRNKLLIILSLLIVLTVCSVTLLSYKRSSKYLYEQAEVRTQQLLEQVGLNIDTYLDELYRLSLTPYYNTAVLSELENPQTDEDRQLKSRRIIESFLDSMMLIPRKDILRVYIFTPAGYYASIKTPYEMDGLSEYQYADWYIQAQQSTSRIILPVHTEPVFDRQGTQIFSIVQSIRSLDENNRVIGVMKVDANYSGIRDICDQVQLGDGAALAIVDSDSHVIYENNRMRGMELDEHIFRVVYDLKTSTLKTIDAKRYLLNTYMLDTVNWKIAAIHAESALNLSSRKTRNESLVIASAFMVMNIVVLFVFVQFITKPFLQMVNLMRTVQSGDLSVRAKLDRQDEIGYLGDSFDDMLQAIETSMQTNTRLAREVYEARYLQKKAQYNALCSQIRPHFLYNTLNTISLQIKSGQNEKAIIDIDHFSALLRSVINTDRDIMIEEELKIIRAYLSLLQSRLGDRLKYTISIDEKWNHVMIPALCIQPLVENAVIHGVEHKRGRSVIQIYSDVEGDDLLIVVQNDGSRIHPGKVADIRFRLKSGDDEREMLAESGVGLVNVNRRIQLKYGVTYGLHIDSNDQCGVTCTLRLPSEIAT